MTDYPVLPRGCQNGTCGHDPGKCIRYRSARCLSGECTHAASNLMCGTTAEADQDDYPPCGKCGKSPADHLGWAQGHLWIRRMNHQQPAEVQHPQGAGATATPAPRPHLPGCSAGEDPDGETVCVCESIAAQPAPDPREEIECTPELIDGRYYGCGVCEACNAVTPQ